MKKRLLNILFAFLICFPAIPLAAQDNICNDPKAKNTGKSAPCKYPATRKIFKKTTKLDHVLAETSGLLYVKGFIWTHNDGGGEAALYKVDPKNGKILQKVSITNTKNKDWEDLAQDDKFVYIGDFGNNRGRRKDLIIYKIKKAELNKNSTTASAEMLAFSYPEQTDFAVSDQHNFDCEAFFCWNNELHLFTKNRGNAQTQHYTIPITPGNHKAQLQETLDAKGMITAADISSDGTVVLIGYTPGKLFMWICRDYAGTQFFSGKNRRIKMGKFIFRGQIEGLCFSEAQKGYISAEHFKIVKQHLRFFSLDKWR